MEVFETTDSEIIDRLICDTVLPPSRGWITLGNWTVLAAVHEGEPVAGALILPNENRPEVHIVVPLQHRGFTTIAAFDGFRRWVVENRPQWERVWAYSDEPQTLRFAHAMGFVDDHVEGSIVWMYYQLKGAA